MARAPHGAYRAATATAPTTPDPRLDDDDALTTPESPMSVDAVRQWVDTLVEKQRTTEISHLERQYDRVRTPDGRLRRARFIGAVLGLRFEKYSTADIAAILGVKRATVLKAMRMVRADATIAEQLKRMDEQILPLAVDNLMQAVADGDMRASMKVLDGRGLFRTHKSLEAQITEQRIDIKLLIERPAHLPADVPLPGCKPGTLAIGAPSGKRPDIDVQKEPEP